MVKLLQLMQLTDGTLPIGTAAHSFGLESLAEWEFVRPETLEAFLRSYLQEQGPVECLYARAAFSAGVMGRDPAFLCRRLDAIRQPRESREASISLGRRFLSLCQSIASAEDAERLRVAFHEESPHHVLVFGFVGALLGFNEEETVAAFLHQAIAAMVSSAQRLMPVGQRQATALQWAIKVQIVSVVKGSRSLDLNSVGSFLPFLDIASMRHPRLETRLFLS